MLIVQKFGGSSLADRERLRHVAELCLERSRAGDELVVVVSAMGDTTDKLTQRAFDISGRPSARELDALMITGEQQSAALLVMMMEKLGLEAVSLTGWQAGILTDCRHGDGDIRLVAPVRISEELSRGRIPVVTGFQGICTSGDMTTLGRGGSDTTATALAAALDAEYCEIYTDVDGIYTADPRLIPEAKLLGRIDYRDMLALARAGSQVLHPKSVELAMANSVRLRLLSSFRGEGGTELRYLRNSQRPRFAGITHDRESGYIALAGKGADAAALSEAALRLSKHGIELNKGTAEDGTIRLLTAEDTQTEAMLILHREMILEQR